MPALSVIGHEGERYILELFQQSFPRPERELAEFFARLQGTRLPFPDLIPLLRRLDFPVYPPYFDGPPPAYYYFVKTGWGSHRPAPSDPLDFYCTDGFGINLGCPLRLHQALKTLATLPEPLKSECEQDLSVENKHLSAIEELLWLEIWQRPFVTTRTLGSSSRSEDWIVQTTAGIFRQECKRRPSDWVRLRYGDAFMPKTFLSNPAGQLPNPPINNQLNVVSITGMMRVTEPLRNLIGRELGTFHNIHVLMYRTFAGETSLFSLTESNLQKVSENMAPQAAVPFQPIYHVIVNRAQTEMKNSFIQAAQPSAPVPESPQLFSCHPTTVPSPTRFFIPPDPYHLDVVNRLPTGEPVFQVIGRYLAGEAA